MRENRRCQISLGFAVLLSVLATTFAVDLALAQPSPEIRSFSESVLPTKPIVDIDVSPFDFSGKHPADRSDEVAELVMPTHLPMRGPFCATWVAPRICYQPLYFEDVVLERYGQTTGPLTQPFVSAIRFGADAALLPLRLWREPYNSCDSPDGFYRPGDPTCDQRQKIVRQKVIRP